MNYKRDAQKVYRKESEKNLDGIKREISITKKWKEVDGWKEERNIERMLKNIKKEKADYVDKYYERYVERLGEGGTTRNRISFKEDRRMIGEIFGPAHVYEKLSKEEYERLLFDVLDWEIRDIEELVNDKPLYYWRETYRKGKLRYEKGRMMMNPVPLVLGNGVIYVNERCDRDEMLLLLTDIYRESQTEEDVLFNFLMRKRMDKYVVDGDIGDDFLGVVEKSRYWKDVMDSYGFSGGGFYSENFERVERGMEILVMGDRYENDYSLGLGRVEKDVKIERDESWGEGEICDVREIEWKESNYVLEKRTEGLVVVEGREGMLETERINVKEKKDVIIEYEDYVILYGKEYYMPEGFKERKKVVETLERLF